MNSWILIIFNGLSFLLYLIILMLKLSKIWPAEAPSCSFLCLWNILPWFFFFFRTSFLCDIIRFRPFYLSDSCPAISHFFMHLRFLLVGNGIRDKDRGRQGHSHWDVFPFAMFSKQLRNTCRCKHTHALTYPHYYKLRTCVHLHKIRIFYKLWVLHPDTSTSRVFPWGFSLLFFYSIFVCLFLSEIPTTLTHWLICSLLYLK